MDEMYEIILEHLTVHSHSISFPELALPVILKVIIILLIRKGILGERHARNNGNVGISDIFR